MFNDKKLRSKLKKTKQKFPLRFWRKSKFIEEDYDEGKQNLLDFYKEKGYRDARIVRDTLINNEDNSITINFDLEEGNQYYFGDISYLGNSVYTDYNSVRYWESKRRYLRRGIIKKRIADEKPDANDLTNLYQNNGYLFSNINAVEVSAENDTINFEIRVSEGKQASFNKISVVGNNKTNDHVIYRELRTKPEIIQ